MRTFVYVDGFNLYYRALKGTEHKWLDLLTLSELALPAGSEVERINYYTARVSGKRNPDMPRRQQIYFSALKTLPCVKIRGLPAGGGLGARRCTVSYLRTASPGHNAPSHYTVSSRAGMP